MATGAGIALAFSLMLAGCGPGSVKNEVLGVQYVRPTSTSTPNTGASPITTPVTDAATARATTARATAPETSGNKTPSLTTGTTVPGAAAGRVTSAGEPISGATVTATGNGASRQATTDAAGNYRLDGLTPGRYQLDMVDHGDDTSVCDSSGSCITKRPPSERVTDVAVTSGATTVADFAV